MKITYRGFESKRKVTSGSKINNSGSGTTKTPPLFNKYLSHVLMLTGQLDTAQCMMWCWESTKL